MIASSMMGLLSPGGLCRTFDEAADGVGIGEGCGAVVLKRLGDALADGDPIVATIRGSAINQDGRSNGLTAPSGTAQVAVIRRALHAAGVDGRTIGYVETHGTGTPLGDPIEVEALAEALGRDGPPCRLGAVKTNFGHLTAAAGIAGLQKAALVVERAEIPRNLHFSRLNPHIDLGGTRFSLPGSLEAWPRSEEPRRAAVSSFGWSGTNCHVVLEQAPLQPPPRESAREEVLLLSARDPAALRMMADRYRAFLAPGGTGSRLSLADICFTAAARRTHHRHRRVASGRTHHEIAAALAGDGRHGWPAALEPPIRAYLAGQPVDVQALFPAGGRCVRLPAYAWQRQAFWLPVRGPDRASLGDGSAVAGRPLRGALVDRLRTEPHFRRRAVLVEFLCSEVASVLGFDAGRPIDADEGFFQLGMTSVGAVALHRRLEAACDHRWPIATVFENKRVTDLAEFLSAGALRGLFLDGDAESLALQPTETAATGPDDEIFASLRSTLDRLEAAKPEQG